MYQNCAVQKSVCFTLMMCSYLLDLGWAEGGAEETSLLDVSLPQPLPQLVQLLHAHRGELTGVRAALRQTVSSFYSQMWPNRRTPAMARGGIQSECGAKGWQESIMWDLVF